MKWNHHQLRVNLAWSQAKSTTAMSRHWRRARTRSEPAKILSDYPTNRAKLTCIKAQIHQQNSFPLKSRNQSWSSRLSKAQSAMSCYILYAASKQKHLHRVNMDKLHEKYKELLVLQATWFDMRYSVQQKYMQIYRWQRLFGPKNLFSTSTNCQTRIDVWMLQNDQPFEGGGPPNIPQNKQQPLLLQLPLAENSRLCQRKWDYMIFLAIPW